MARIAVEELKSFATALIQALGSPPEIAQVVAESLVGADLRGHGSHGVRRLSTLYPTMIDAGDLDPTAEPTIEHEGATAAKIDGQQGWGHYTGRRAVELAVEKARDGPVAAVGVKNGAHLGRIGEFVERAAMEGILAVAFVNTGGTGEMAAAPGTTDRNISVNPLAVGIPTFGAVEFPVVLDIASGQVAHGKIMKKALAGDPLPPDWAIGNDGEPLHDAQAFEDGLGAILPLGGEQFGYKGAGLSLTLELVAGLIGDNAVHGETAPFRVNNGVGLFAVDPTWFLSEEGCRNRVSALADHLREQEYDPDLVTPPGKEGTHPQLPGEPEYHHRQERESAGIPLDDGAIANLRETAADHGITDLPAGFAE